MRVHAIPLAHPRSSALRYPAEYVAFLVRALPRVCLLSLRRRHDAVQVDNVPDLLVLAALPARWRGARLVHFMYELMPELTAARLRATERHPVVRATRAMERLATGWADAVVVVTEPCRRRLVDRGVSSAKLRVIPNTQASPAVTEAPAPARPVLVVVTTLIERYGVDVAIRALPHLVERRPEITLEVLGDGPCRDSLTELAASLGVAERVRFLGFVPWPEAMARVRAASLGLVPTVDDGYGGWLLPNKLLEYVAHGVPAVCSRMATVAEYFDDEAVAYFEPGDPRDLARQVDRLLDDPERARRQVAAALRAYRWLSWEEVSERYLTALSGDGR